LGFHDFVPNGPAGGCDDCINSTNHDNSGLLLSVDSLAPIVTELETPEFSRADIWALAVLVAADLSTPELINFTASFRTGRKNCETVGTCRLNHSSQCASIGPDTRADFPTTIFTTHELIDFMTDHFGFNADETVILMGAHTLGRALPTNSGHGGENRWVTSHHLLGKFTAAFDVMVNVLTVNLTASLIQITNTTSNLRLSRSC
jgi:Peroxidase